MHDERIEKLEIYDHRARGESSSTLSRGNLHEKSFFLQKHRCDCGNFHFKSSMHHFYFFPPWNLNSPVIGQWENIFPQIACSELAGLDNRCHAMALTLLRASCDCDVTFDIISDFFRSFRCKLCKIMQFLFFLVPATAFRTTNQTTTAGRTPFATTCRLIRTSAKATRPKLAPAICGRFRVVSLKRTSWHGNTLVFLENISIYLENSSNQLSDMNLWNNKPHCS